MMAIQGEITLVVSNFVLEEVRRNLALAAPQVLDVFEFFLDLAPFEITAVTSHDVSEAARHTVFKDAPILAAAKVSGAAMLVTLDKKHLLGKPKLAAYIGFPIVTPREAFLDLK